MILFLFFAFVGEQFVIAPVIGIFLPALRRFGPDEAFGQDWSKRQGQHQRSEQGHRHRQRE